MISKKDDRMIDLEYMIPKEFKEPVVAEEEPEREISVLASADVCHSCNKSSHESVLMPVVERGTRKLLCSRCFKDTMDSDSYSGSSISSGYPDTSDAYSEGYSDTQAETESSSASDSSGSSPMSMFD